MEDNERKSKCGCIRCGKLIKNLDIHIKTCKKAIENIDYIKCKICEEKHLVLYVHCKSHGLTSEEYEKKYGQLMCSESLERISERNRQTQEKSNFRNKLKQQGRVEELKIFNEKMAQNVSKTVLADPNLRKIRSGTLGRLNKTDQFRKKASETAIKTSSNPEIIQKRIDRLLKWKKENPEKVQLYLSQTHFQSDPERILFEFCLDQFPHFFFKRNQQLNRRNIFKINKSGIKQIDILSLSQKIVIEFDGPHHFKNIQKWNQLDYVKAKDEELNSLYDEFMIIRVSNDQFSYKKSTYGFKQECLNELQKLLEKPRPGLFLIGALYAQDKIN
jgi:very-short-patch-repair endonuclease